MISDISLKKLFIFVFVFVFVFILYLLVIALRSIGGSEK